MVCVHVVKGARDLSGASSIKEMVDNYLKFYCHVFGITPALITLRLVIP